MKPIFTAIQLLIGDDSRRYPPHFDINTQIACSKFHIHSHIWVLKISYSFPSLYTLFYSFILSPIYIFKRIEFNMSSSTDSITANQSATEISRDVRPLTIPTQACISDPARNSETPLWVSAIWVLLVAVLCFLVMSLEKYVENVVENAMQAMDLKLNEFEKKADEMDLKLNEIIDGFMQKSLLYKDEFDRFFYDFMKTRKYKNLDDGKWGLDEIRDYVKEIVEKEIEKHAADGLGMEDYATGRTVLKHSSDQYGIFGVGSSWSWFNLVSLKSGKMISPSFGELGSCFALMGRNGFVEIRLRATILPEAVTLEHVAKGVSNDRSNAPKQCRVFGWLQGQDITDRNKTMLLLSEFTYELKHNSQTYKVLESAVSAPIDCIRFEFMSNHGNKTHTCIYRLRVHGNEYVDSQIRNNKYNDQDDLSSGPKNQVILNADF